MFFFYLFNLKTKVTSKDYLVLTVSRSLLVLLLLLPWLISASGSYKTIDFDNLFTQFATHLIPVLNTGITQFFLFCHL